MKTRPFNQQEQTHLREFGSALRAASLPALSIQNAGSTWKQGTPKQLLDDLRPGGWVFGRSGLLNRLLRLHKTDLMTDLRKQPADQRLTWQITGNPDETGRYAARRRTVVVWLGQ